MRINRGLLGWGGFLVLAGAVPLAVRTGYLTEDQVGSLGSLWPLILIGIGIGILLARTRLAFLGGLLIAATLGLIVGGVLSGGIEGFGECGPGRETTAFEPHEGAFGAGPGSIDIHLNCGDLRISTAAGRTWRIAGDDRDGTGPDVDSENGSLSVRSRDRAGGPFGLGDHETWQITLPVDIRFDLNLEVNAGSSTVSLGGASVDALELQLNAGSATVDLGLVERIDEVRVNLNAGSLDLTLPNRSVTGSIEANAGSVNLCVPPGAALKLTTNESIVASYAFEDRGLVKDGSTWQTPGFDDAAVRIELDTRANAGSFSLNPEDGCGG